jgi:hypothetical protein
MSNITLIKKFAVCIMLALFMFVLSPTFALADSNSASSAISSAQNKIYHCYSAAKDAEAASANISSLTATLNQAGQLLDQAGLAYSKGDFDAASNYAQQSQAKLNSFLFDASTLKNAAAQQQTLNFYLGTVGSIGGAIAIVAIGILLWVRIQGKDAVTEAKAVESSET